MDNGYVGWDWRSEKEMYRKAGRKNAPPDLRLFAVELQRVVHDGLHEVAESHVVRGWAAAGELVRSLVEAGTDGYEVSVRQLWAAP